MKTSDTETETKYPRRRQCDSCFLHREIEQGLADIERRIRHWYVALWALSLAMLPGAAASIIYLVDMNRQVSVLSAIAQERQRTSAEQNKVLAQLVRELDQHSHPPKPVAYPRNGTP